MCDLVFLASFDADVQAEYERREEWRPDAGDLFYTRLTADLDQLTRHPSSGSGVKGSRVRRLLVVGFRYSVIYVLDGRRVMLHALLDQLANPEINAQRLREVIRLLSP
jgi:plasmid stabilization system protein ParE